MGFDIQYILYEQWHANFNTKTADDNTKTTDDNTKTTDDNTKTTDDDTKTTDLSMEHPVSW